MIHDLFDDVVHRVVDTLHHAREYKDRLHHVLVGINADHEVRRAPVLLALLLNRVESAESRITRSSEDHVRAFADLGQRQFLAFTGIVPGTVSHANVVFDHANVRIHRLRAFFVTFREAMYQTDVHAAEKTDRARARRFGGEYADEIRAFVFFENE